MPSPRRRWWATIFCLLPEPGFTAWRQCRRVRWPPSAAIAEPARQCAGLINLSWPMRCQFIPRVNVRGRAQALYPKPRPQKSQPRQQPAGRHARRHAPQFGPPISRTFMLFPRPAVPMFQRRWPTLRGTFASLTPRQRYAWSFIFTEGLSAIQKTAPDPSRAIALWWALMPGKIAAPKDIR